MSSLFLDQNFNPTFEKISMPVKLSDNPDSWQREIASEVFKQLPYLAEFSVNVVLDRVDPQRGYAFGSAEVTNNTDSPIPDQPEAAVHIPIIVKDRLLQPLDVMLDGKEALPLNERRLREKLFRTASFETSTRKPTDQGMVDQLYPPMRTNYGYGNAVSTGVGVGGFGKQAAADQTIKNLRHDIALAQNPAQRKYLREELAEYRHLKQAHLCDAIAGTISDEQFDRFLHKVASDEETNLLFRRNSALQSIAMDLASRGYTPSEKTAQALVQSIRPTVVQFTKLASGNFLIKWANADAFAPQQAQIDQGQAASMAGQDLSAMRPGQTATITTQRAQKQGLDEPDALPITEFGDYVVKDADSGQTYSGTVLPVVDFQMQPLPLLVFTDGAGHYGTQDEIVGIRQDGPGGAALGGRSGSQPQGDGIFVYAPKGEAKPFCTQPLTITAVTQGPDGAPQFMAEDVFGAQLTLVLTPGLMAFEPLDEDGTVAIPDDMQWIPLEGEPVHLAKGDTPDPVGDAKGLPGEVGVASTGPGEVSLDGLPLAKVARSQRQFLKTAEATFLLCAMGLTQDEAGAAISEAESRTSHLVKLAGLRPITPLADLHEKVEKRASILLQQFDYEFWRRDVVKEAAALEDSETADKVLAMNFINPENLSIFASYLPDLDTTSTKLAEMLLASRLGMNQVPEGAAERAMKNMEEVISGLRSLQQKELV